jgi:hypothetical protein
VRGRAGRKAVRFSTGACAPVRAANRSFHDFQYPSVHPIPCGQNVNEILPAGAGPHAPNPGLLLLVAGARPAPNPYFPADFLLAGCLQLMPDLQALLGASGIEITENGAPRPVKWLDLSTISKPGDMAEKPGFRTCLGRPGTEVIQPGGGAPGAPMHNGRARFAVRLCRVTSAGPGNRNHPHRTDDTASRLSVLGSRFSVLGSRFSDLSAG